MNTALLGEVAGVGGTQAGDGPGNAARDPGAGHGPSTADGTSPEGARELPDSSAAADGAPGASGVDGTPAERPPTSASTPLGPCAARDQLQPGTSILGKYEVQGVLGQGGFAVVYDAEHVGLRRRVAIKVLHVGKDTPLALIERFRREARISALVRHRNVLEAYDTGTLPDGSPYLVMERINGQNLSALLARGPLPIATAVEIGRQLLLGLSAIAGAGIVHRDIKPENVMLHDPGDGGIVVKLVDFGIAKRVCVAPEPRLTYHGALVGTPQYMAPEQIRGEEVDVRSDIYATGVILYEAVSGHPPHETSNFSELVVAVLSGRIDSLRRLRPNCPPELDRVVLRALSRARARRYGSPGEFLYALEQVANKYALPRGAEAFRASGDTEWSVLGPARHCTTFVRWLRQPSGPRSRALQLTFMVLLLGAPGAALRVHDGAGAAPKLDAPLAGVAKASGKVEVGAPVVSHLSSSTRAPQATPSPVAGQPLVVAALHAPAAAVPQDRAQAGDTSSLGERTPQPAPAVTASDRGRESGAGHEHASAAASELAHETASASEHESVRPSRELEFGRPREGEHGAERADEGEREQAASHAGRFEDDGTPAGASGSAPGADGERAPADRAALLSHSAALTASGADGVAEPEAAGGGAPSAADPETLAAGGRQATYTEAEALAGAPALSEPGGTKASARSPLPASDDPTKRRAWERAMQEGLAAMVRGQLGAARERYLEAVRIDAREPSGFRGLGLVAARLGDAQQASTALARYLALAPHAPDAAAIRARISTLSSAAASDAQARRSDGKAP